MRAIALPELKRNTGNDLSILFMEYCSAQATTKSCPMAITPSTTILTNWGLQLENQYNDYQMTDTREKLRQYLADEDLISDEKVELIYSLLSMSGMPSKTDILKLAGYDVSKTYDTAYPSPYAERIRELYPDFNNGCHIYDYSENHFGQMVNINNLFAKHVLKTLSIHY